MNTSTTRSEIRPPVASPARAVAWCWCLYALLTCAVARAQDAGVPNLEAPRGASGAASSTTTVDEARRMLNDGNLAVAVLAVHASTLLEAGDLDGLRAVLAGTSPNSMQGVLQALKAGGQQVLLPEVLALAASRPDAGLDAAAPAAVVGAMAREHLANLARAHAGVVNDFVAWLGEGERSEAEALVLIDALGHSRSMVAAPPLLNQLYGPYADAADAALTQLTGHASPAARPDDEASLRARREFWNGFWQDHLAMSRDEILDQALAQVRAAAAEERSASQRALADMQAQVVAARTELMNDDVDKLVAALADPYSDVRRVAAERLGNHANKQLAAAAVPVMLSRLRAVEGSGAGAESAPAVRAALVTALGGLGRNDDAVREALAGELKSAHPMVARAAVQGLSFVRRHPEVVRPLLDYLDRALVLVPAAAVEGSLGVQPGDADLAVMVLQTVAENQPQGVIPRVRTFIEPHQPTRVRAMGVRALLACEDADSALDQLAGLDIGIEDQLVRFNVALGLGARVLDLPAGSPARPRIVQLLGRLVDDPDPSVRAEAAASLGRSGELEALALLERRVQVEVDPSVLKKIVDAFGDLGLREGVRVIGRICAPRNGEVGGERARQLEEAAFTALASIGEQADASTWMTFGDQLREVHSLVLAAWCYLEVERRFSAAPESRLVVNEAKGKRARTLWDMNDLVEARRLLIELHVADAPHPPVRDRLEMLASASERLGDHAVAADAFLELLGMIQPGASGRLQVQRDAVRTLIAAQRWSEAAPLLDELIAASPSDNDLLSERARIEQGQGRWEQALATLQRLLDRIPATEAGLRAEVQGRIGTLRSRIAGAPLEGTPSRDAGEGQP